MNYGKDTSGRTRPIPTDVVLASERIRRQRDAWRRTIADATPDPTGKIAGIEEGYRMALAALQG